MGILDRISTLIKSNLNSAIDKVSDPGKEIDQIVIEMEQQQKQARVEVQGMLALEKREQMRVDALKKTVDEWNLRAERALKAGDEGLAKEALARRLDSETQLQEAEASVAHQKAGVTELTQALRALDQRVKEVKARKETLKVQARMQKQKDVGGSAFDRYDQLVTDVDVKEAEVELGDELLAATHKDSKSAEVERRFADLEGKSAVDDKLAALKAKLEAAKTPAALPAAAADPPEDKK